jgi:hypothetical protein
MIERVVSWSSTAHTALLCLVQVHVVDTSVLVRMVAAVFRDSIVFYSIPEAVCRASHDPGSIVLDWGWRCHGEKRQQSYDEACNDHHFEKLHCMFLCEELWC